VILFFKFLEQCCSLVAELVLGFWSAHLYGDDGSILGNRFLILSNLAVRIVDEVSYWRHIAIAGRSHALDGSSHGAVIDACEEKVDFKYLYDLDTPLRERVERIAKEVYGADGVSYSAEAAAKAERFEADPKFNDYVTMMVKTHLSLSHDPTLKGVPKGWTLPIRDFLTYSGAKFICPVAGNISLMPGTGSNPAYRRVDIDAESGKVTGLF